MTCTTKTCVINFILLTLVAVAMFTALTASYTIIRIFVYFIDNKDVLSICTFLITVLLIILLIASGLYYKVKKEDEKYANVVLPYYFV